jgi:CBS domain-containing protein
MTRRHRHAHHHDLAERGPFTEWARHLEAGVSSLSSTPVSEVMRRRVPPIDEHETEATLVELLLDHGVHGVPVVDRDRFLVGFVSATDLVRAHHEDGEGKPCVVRELMTAVAVDLVETASLAKAALLMASYRVHQVPVVTELGHVVGMVTASDILAWLCQMETH